MREEKLLQLIGQIDDTYIEEAADMKESKKPSWLRWCALAASIALCICAALAGHAAHQKYNTVVSYICIDVNPSFELCLNHKNQVIDAISYNADGTELLSKIDYHHRHYEDVLNSILQHDAFEKHLVQDLTVTIVSEDADAIKQCIQANVEAAQCNGRVQCSDLQTRDTAYSNHCSVGKYVAYTELSQYDKEITLEDCKGMKMQEIYNEIEKHHSTHHNDQSNGETITQEGTHSDHHSGHH